DNRRLAVAQVVGVSVIADVYDWNDTLSEGLHQRLKARTAGEAIQTRMRRGSLPVKDTDYGFKRGDEEGVRIRQDKKLPDFDGFTFANAEWQRNGKTIIGGRQKDNVTYQVYHLYGIFIDDDQTIIIADRRNHRIVQWKQGDKEGQVIFSDLVNGTGMNQLYHPTDVLVDRTYNSLIICDQSNRKIMQWCLKRYHIDGKNEIVVAGSQNRGAKLHELNTPDFIFVNQQQTVYVSDIENHRVMEWKKDARVGKRVAVNQTSGDNAEQLRYPNGVFVDLLDTVYVADYQNDRVMRWCQGASFVSLVVGGQGEGWKPHQLDGPRGLFFDERGNLYVIDCNNNRIQQYLIK
ncbi:unnamed protein product, partial [Didymodactylos carnosus]